MLDKRDIKYKELSSNRVLELKYWCFQYPEWKKISRNPQHPKHQTALDNIQMIEITAQEVFPDYSQFLLMNLTEGYSYDRMKLKHRDLYVSKSVFHEYRKEFFIQLDAKKQ